MNDIKRYLDERGIVKFELLSVNYIIEVDGTDYLIYEELYPNNKQRYKSFTDLMDNYLIYNEPIKNSLENITLL